MPAGEAESHLTAEAKASPTIRGVTAHPRGAHQVGEGRDRGTEHSFETKAQQPALPNVANKTMGSPVDGRDDDDRPSSTESSSLSTDSGKRIVSDLEQTLLHKKEHVAALKSEVQSFKDKLLAITMGHRSTTRRLMQEEISYAQHEKVVKEKVTGAQLLPTVDSGSPDVAKSKGEEDSLRRDDDAAVAINVNVPGGATVEHSLLLESDKKGAVSYARKENDDEDFSVRADLGGAFPSTQKSDIRPAHADNSQSMHETETARESSAIDPTSDEACKVRSEQLASENAYLRERLAVAEARASHISEVDALLQETECAAANLEREIAAVQDTTDAQMEQLQRSTRKEIALWEEKDGPRNCVGDAESEQSRQKQEDYEDRLRAKDLIISTLAESLEAAETEVAAFQKQKRQENASREEDSDDIRHRKKAEAEVNERIEALENQNKERIKELERASQTIKESYNTINSLNEEKTANQRTLQILRAEMADLKEKLQLAKEEKNEEQMDPKKKDQEEVQQQTLLMRIESLENENRERVEDLERASQTIKESYDTINVLNEEKGANQNKERIKELERASQTIKESYDTINILNEEKTANLRTLQILRAEMADLKEQLKLAKEQKNEEEISRKKREEEEGAQTLMRIESLENENKERIKELELASLTIKESYDTINSLNEEKGANQKTLQILHAEMADLKKKLQLAKEQKDKEQVGRKNKDDEEGAQQSLIKTLEKENDFITDRNIALQKEIDFLLKDLEYSKSFIEKSEADIKRLEEDKDRICKEHQESLEVLQNELADAHRSKSTIESGLKNRIASLEKSHQLAVETVEKREITIKEIERELADVQQKNSAISNTLDEKDRELKTVLDENNSLNQQNTSLLEEIRVANESLDELNKEFSCSQASLTRVEREKDDIRDGNQDSLAALKRELEETKNKKDDIETEWKKKVESLQRSCRLAIGRQETNDNLIESLQHDLEKAQKTCVARGDKISQQERELWKLLEEKNILNEEILSLREKVHALERSLDDSKTMLKESESLAESLQTEKAQMQRDYRAAVDTLRKEFENSTNVQEGLEADLRKQLKELQQSHQGEVEELKRMLKKRNDTIDTLEKVSALHKQTISSQRVNVRQVKERIKVQVPNAQNERLSRAFTKDISEASKCAQLLASEIAELRSKLSAMEGKGSRVSELEVLVKESESILYQFEHERVSFDAEKKGLLTGATKEQPESAQQRESELRKQLETLELRKDGKIKELEKQIQECQASDLEFEEEVMTLRREKDKLEEALSLSSKRFNEQDSEHRRRIESFESEREAKLNDMQLELQECHATIERLLIRTPSRGQELASSISEDDDILTTKRYNDELQQELSASAKRIAAQGKDLQLLMNDLRTARSSNERLRKQVASLRDRVATLEQSR